MKVDHCRGEVGVPQVLLNEFQADTSFEKVSRVAVPQGMSTDATVVPIELTHDRLDHPLNGGFAHGSLGRVGHGVVFAFGGKEPNWVSMGAVVVTHDLEGRVRERNETILGPLSAMDMHQHAFGVDVVDLKMECFLKPQSQ